MIFLELSKETEVVNHKIMVPYGISGEVVSIASGDFTIDEVVYEIKNWTVVSIKEHLCKMACPQGASCF